MTLGKKPDHEEAILSACFTAKIFVIVTLNKASLISANVPVIVEVLSDDEFDPDVSFCVEEMK